MAKIAYLILTHGQPYQTIDFLWSIWREEDAYFVHVDRKSPAFSAAALAAVAAAYPNVHIVPADICTWGGFTLVEAALRCLTAALRAECEWSHAVLVSGSHLPLRRAAAFAAALEPEVSYMTLHRLDLDPANQSPPGRFSGRASRFSYEYEEVRGIGAMRGHARQVPAGSAFFWGSQW